MAINSGLYAIEAMVNDPQLTGRLRASVSKEGAAGSIPAQPDPVAAVFGKRYDLCAAPGWAESYLYALQTGVESPGADSAVIADDAVGAQVVAVFGA
jgi:hypothetical protein